MTTALTVEVDWNNNGTFDGGNEDISSYVRSVSYRAGSSDLLKQRYASVGQCTLVVNNTTKIFSPAYTSGALYGSLLPGRQVRLTATVNSVAYVIFRGFIVSLAPTSGTTIGTTATLVCEDIIGYLQDYKLKMPLLENVTGDTVVKHIINFALGAPTATAVIRLTANPANGEQVTVNDQTYTFVTVLGSTPNNVLIGTTMNDTATNLSNCMNNGDGAGSTYVSSSNRPSFITGQAETDLPDKATMWHLSSNVVSGGAISATTGTLPYNHYSSQATPVNGNTFTNGFFVAPGTYQLTVLGQQSTDRGMVDWYVDGVLIESGQDWYAGSAAAYSVQTGRFQIQRGGWHVLKGVVNGKNASSSGYKLGLTKMFVGPRVLSDLPTHTSLWHLASNVISGGAISPTTTSGPYNYYASQATPLNGDTFTNGFFVDSGQYNLIIYGKANTDRGKIDWYLDGTLIASGQDWYASQALDGQTKVAASVYIRKGGWHVLKGVVNGKNSASTGYKMGLVKFVIKQAIDQ